MKTLRKPIWCSLLLSVLGLTVGGCYTEPTTPQGQEELTSASQRALQRMEQDDPSLQNILNNSYAYVIFPSVGEGAVGVGGAHGHGEAYRGGRLIGYAEMTLVDIGVQVGGQEYSELLVFRTQDAFNKFTNNNFTFAASASAVILKSGAAAQAKWSDDVLVFQRAEGGAFVGAAIGGQRFTYKAVSGG